MSTSTTRASKLIPTNYLTTQLASFSRPQGKRLLFKTLKWKNLCYASRWFFWSSKRPESMGRKSKRPCPSKILFIGTFKTRVKLQDKRKTKTGKKGTKSQIWYQMSSPHGNKGRIWKTKWMSTCSSSHCRSIQASKSFQSGERKFSFHPELIKTPWATTEYWMLKSQSMRRCLLPTRKTSSLCNFKTGKRVIHHRIWLAGINLCTLSRLTSKMNRFKENLTQKNNADQSEENMFGNTVGP